MLVSHRATLAGVAVGGDAPVVVIGALNVSPESFYSGSVHSRPDDLLTAALAMVEAGAAIIDVGARSTAPYRATALPLDVERARLVHAVEALAAKLPVPVSADTTSATVAEAALERGARIVNDVSGLGDPAMARVVERHGASLLLMAHPGSAATPRSGEPVAIVRATLSAALDRARAAGIPDARVALDPGIGFFRDEAWPWPAWDLHVLANLAALHEIGRPLAVGVSRKSFIGAVTGRAEPAERLAGSLAAAVMAVSRGAAAIRTHDVAETIDAVRMAERVAEAARR